MLFVAVAFSAACSAVALAISHLNDSTILDGCIIQPLHQCNLHADLLPRPEQLKVSTQSATAFPASCRRTRAPLLAFAENRLDRCGDQGKHVWSCGAAPSAPVHEQRGVDARPGHSRDVPSRCYEISSEL